MLEDELEESQSLSDKLRKENDKVHNVLGVEKAKVASLTKEKSSALEEKKLALREKASTL